MTVSPARLSAANLIGFERADVAVPAYDRSRVTAGIVHIGVGGFHRAHQAMYIDALLNQGLADDWGICGVGLLDKDRRMAEVMRAQDGLYTLITKAPDGSRSARVIGSLIDYLYAPDEPDAVLAKLAAPETRVLTLTVTESGYNTHRVTGGFDVDGPGIAHDLAHPHGPTTVFGFVAEALARRRAAGVEPFTVVSCDNVQGNGEVTRAAFTAFARLRDPDLGEWMDAEVAFPNSMVDRITPATTDADCALVQQEYGLDDEWPVVCEPFSQWVLEDRFRLGRPPLEQAGVQVVDDVEPYERMKLRLLNGSHQGLAYAGQLAGYRMVHEAMADPVFVEFSRGYMRQEALPSLLPVPGIDLDRYMDEVLERFANPHIADTLARVAVDGSERMTKFVLPVIRHQLESGGPVERAITIVACWARYATGVDEHGNSLGMVDPAHDALREAAARQGSNPLAFVENRDIFGDLVDRPRFADIYRRAIGSVFADGARATLARCR